MFKEAIAFEALGVQMQRRASARLLKRALAGERGVPRMAPRASRKGLPPLSNMEYVLTYV